MLGNEIHTHRNLKGNRRQRCGKLETVAFRFGEETTTTKKINLTSVPEQHDGEKGVSCPQRASKAERKKIPLPAPYSHRLALGNCL